MEEKRLEREVLSVEVTEVMLRPGFPGVMACPGLPEVMARPEAGFPIRIHVRIPGSDPHSKYGSGSGFRRTKMTHKNRKKSRIFMFLSTGCSLLRSEGFSCSLCVLYGGLGINKLQFLIKKIEIKFPAINFFPF